MTPKGASKGRGVDFRCWFQREHVTFVCALGVGKVSVVP